MRVLVLGGTGAMGVHVCDLLAARGDEVTVTSRSARTSSTGVKYLQGDAKSSSFLTQVLSEGWDAVVDFMIWSTSEFRVRVPSLLSATRQYMFLSSYRVYADAPLITEQSPRLLEVVDDAEYLKTDEYALAKARCEDLLFESGDANWTIVRPAITYDGSVGRLQLGVMESAEWLWRARQAIPVPMPNEMQHKQATMTYAGDVARLIVGLVGNPAAFGEAFTVSTSEHITWQDVADSYATEVPLRLDGCTLEDFERVRGATYQLRYDRMFDRIVDNAKVLAATGILQESFVGMRSGLAGELRKYLATAARPAVRVGANARMDRLVGGCASLRHLLRDNDEMPVATAGKYAVRRFIR